MITNNELLVMCVTVSGMWVIPDIIGAVRKRRTPTPPPEEIPEPPCELLFSKHYFARYDADNTRMWAIHVLSPPLLKLVFYIDTEENAVALMERLDKAVEEELNTFENMTEDSRQARLHQTRAS